MEKRLKKKGRNRNNFNGELKANNENFYFREKQ